MQLKQYLQLSAYRAILMMSGSFVDRNGVGYTVHILHRPTDDPQLGRIDSYRWEYGSLRFGSTPLIIEREGERMAGLVVSKARLRVLSEEDGQFRYLLGLAEGAVMLVLWRGNDLEWIGSLDPESYEEDYTRERQYFVDLTFSDFGRSKRLRHKFRGHKSLKEWIVLSLKNALTYPEGGLTLAQLPLSMDEYMHNSLDVRSLLAVGFPEVISASGIDEEGEELAPSYNSLDIGYRPALQGLIVSSQAFYENLDDSLTLYDMIDGILSSLGLCLEQRGGRFVIYDRDTLLRSEAEALTVRSDDALYVADEAYTAVNIEIESRAKLASVQYDIPEVWGDSTVVHPRIDRPELSAYRLHYRPIPSVRGAYYVTSEPITTGERDTFIALCLQPTAGKACYLSRRNPEIIKSLTYLRTDYYQEGGNKVISANIYSGRVHAFEYEKPEENPGGNVMARFYIGHHTAGLDGGDSYLLCPSCLGYERWQGLTQLSLPNKLFTPWAFRSAPLLDLEMSYMRGSGKGLALGAKLFASFYPSLYQGLDERFAGSSLVQTQGNDTDIKDFIHGKEHVFGAIRNLMLYCQMTITDGSRRYALTFDEEDLSEKYNGSRIYHIEQGKRFRLRWVETASATSHYIEPYFFLSFGGTRFRWHEWNEATHEHILLDEAYAVVEYSDGGRKESIVDHYSKYWEFSPIKQGGLFIPEPPISGEIKLTIYGTLSMGYIQEQRRVRAGVPLNSVWTHSSAYRHGHATSYQTATRYLEEGCLFPSYVLLKDVQLSVVDTQGRQAKDKIERTAQINEFAYEVKDIKPLLSTDEGLANHSPALLLSSDHTRIKELFHYDPELRQAYEDGRLSYADSWRGRHGTYRDTSELLASEAFAHYGKRLHSLEGRFATVRGLKPLSYAGRTYFATEERWDVRACASEYRLSELPSVWYKPTINLGTSSESNNTHYLIK